MGGGWGGGGGGPPPPSRPCPPPHQGLSPPGFTPSGGIDGSTKYLSYIFSEMEPLTHLLIGLFFGAFVGVLCFVLHLLCTKYKTSTRREQKNRLTLALEDLSQCETVPKQTICAFPIQITQETEIDIGFNFRNCKTKKIP